MVNIGSTECHKCNGRLIFYDKVKRILRHNGRKTEWIILRRLRCVNCNSIHRELTKDLLPYKQYESEIIYGVKEATALRVKKTVTVPVMEGYKKTGEDSKEYSLMGIIVNLADYNVGADKNGAVNMFDDSDIDYNAQKYLINTRCSGALIKPYSAIVIEAATE